MLAKVAIARGELELRLHKSRTTHFVHATIIISEIVADDLRRLDMPASQTTIMSIAISLNERCGRVANSGVYFITCIFLGRKFVKIGRSCDVKKRRGELQTGCPFELKIEHVEPMSEAEAVVKEKRWHSQFENMNKRNEWYNTAFDGVQTQLMFKWFPYANDIAAFVEDLKRGESSTDSDSGAERQDLLF